MKTKTIEISEENYKELSEIKEFHNHKSFNDVISLLLWDE